MLQCSVSTLHSTTSLGKKTLTAEVTHRVSGSQVSTVSVKQAPKVDGENMHLIHEKEVPQLHSVANPHYHHSYADYYIRMFVFLIKASISFYPF